MWPEAGGAIAQAAALDSRLWVNAAALEMSYEAATDALETSNQPRIAETLPQAAEDSLERIRGEYRSGKPTSRRRRELLGEAIEINDRLREQVRQKVSRIGGFLEELDANGVRYRQVVEEIDQGAVTQA